MAETSRRNITKGQFYDHHFFKAFTTAAVRSTVTLCRYKPNKRLRGDSSNDESDVPVGPPSEAPTPPSAAAAAAAAAPSQAKRQRKTKAPGVASAVPVESLIGDVSIDFEMWESDIADWMKAGVAPSASLLMQGAPMWTETSSDASLFSNFEEKHPLSSALDPQAFLLDLHTTDPLSSC